MLDLMTYAELRDALGVLGLSDRATLRDIKRRHRDLVKRLHPDKATEADPEQIRQVNAAYALIRSYLDTYTYSFNEDEFYLQNPEERLRRQFWEDPLWGGIR